MPYFFNIILAMLCHKISQYTTAFFNCICHTMGLCMHGTNNRNKMFVTGLSGYTYQWKQFAETNA